MSSVSARAPVAALRPAASASSPRFLGDSGRVGLAKSTRRDVAVQAKGSWLPGLQSPAYLDGSLAGDNGFDPLALAEDPEDLRWFVQAELVNGRWAMLGVAGMLIPEVLTKAGLLNAPEWYDAGKETYFASSSTLFVIEFILFHYVEIRRWQDIKNPGSVNSHHPPWPPPPPPPPPPSASPWPPRDAPPRAGRRASRCARTPRGRPRR